MQRVIIRNTKSSKTVKPRVFDALIDNGEVFFEVKNAKNSEVISLSDVLKQINNEIRTTEP